MPISYLQALILGIVQGLTEYLPVSSKAHLILVPKIFQWNLSEQVNFIFNVLVQQGTLLGVIIYFWDDLWQIIASVFRCLLKGKPLAEPLAKEGWLVVLASVPAAFFGLTFKKQIEALFNSSAVTLSLLLVTALFLIISEVIGKKGHEHVNTRNALAMGFAQSLALFPGISRSGSTISWGMVSGLKRESAARFSFLMSIPIMIGASLVAGKDLLDSPELLQQMSGPVAVGFIAAAVTGYIVIKWFLRYLKTHSLYIFAAYCLAVGGIGLFLI